MLSTIMKRGQIALSTRAGLISKVYQSTTHSFYFNVVQKLFKACPDKISPEDQKLYCYCARTDRMEKFYSRITQDLCGNGTQFSQSTNQITLGPNFIELELQEKKYFGMYTNSNFHFGFRMYYDLIIF